MKPPCLYMVNEVIPNLRKRISKKLSQEGYTQKQIAESLGITQAMVSKYLKTDLEEIKKRGERIYEDRGVVNNG